MKTFREYYEEKEILDEGVVLNAIGKALGFATVGVAYAWIAALLVKGGKGAYQSLVKTFGREINFKGFLKSARNSPAVKQEMQKIEEKKNKYEAEIPEIINAIRNKDFEVASREYRNLSIDKQNSTEIKQVIIEEIIKVCGIITAKPTPGSEAFQALRKVTNLQTAKAAAKVFEEQLLKINKSGE